MFFVVVYMNIFKHLMSEERGVEYIPWVEAFYWVLTTMSTLGYGDITFTGSSGRLFSMLVMFTGVFYLFIVLPFVFMEFLYKPFMEYQTGARVARKFEPVKQKHVILTGFRQNGLQIRIQRNFLRISTLVKIIVRHFFENVIF